MNCGWEHILKGRTIKSVHTQNANAEEQEQGEMDCLFIEFEDGTELQITQKYFCNGWPELFLNLNWGKLKI
jgi:hypothetical protein